MESANWDRIRRFVVCFQWHANQVPNKLREQLNFSVWGISLRLVGGALGGPRRPTFENRTEAKAAREFVKGK